MKKILLFVLFFLMVFPLSVFAEEKVNVYVFRGEGCPHCSEFMTYIKSLDAYNTKFVVKDYEVWQNEDNALMMDNIAYMRDEDDTATGVPYIIIGDKSWVGYSIDMNTEIEAQIDKVYKQSPSQRYDVIKEYQKNKDSIITKIDDDEELNLDDDYYVYDCEDEGYVTEDTMVGAAILAFIGGLAVAGIPLLVVVIVLAILLIKKKRNG